MHEVVYLKKAYRKQTLKKVVNKVKKQGFGAELNAGFGQFFFDNCTVAANFKKERRK